MADIYIPPKTISLLGSLGLSESSVYDVFSNGTQIPGKNGMTKKYSGYDITILYVRDSNTGRYVITWVGKRERR